MKKTLLVVALITTFSFAKDAMTVYKSASCGCCGKWVDHMKENGYKVKTIIKEDMSSVKNRLGVPQKLSSCHTAVINGYIVEGHVPSDVVDKMLKEKPNIKGIASPGMPIGSPGMEQGDMKQPNTIVTFDKDNKYFIYANK